MCKRDRAGSLQHFLTKCHEESRAERASLSAKHEEQLLALRAHAHAEEEAAKSQRCEASARKRQVAELRHMVHGEELIAKYQEERARSRHVTLA